MRVSITLAIVEISFNIREYLIEAMSEEEIDRCEFWVMANRNFRLSDKHNFEFEQILVNEQYNFEYLEAELEDYPFPQVIEFLKYGWPLNASNTQEDMSLPTNQRGAQQHSEFLEKYIKNELRAGSAIGPFVCNPFGRKARFSPINTREKHDSEDLRVLLNLSHPFASGSVNHSIPKNDFLGNQVKLCYPSVEDLAKLVLIKGPGCHIFIRDLSKAYRQMYMDPGGHTPFRVCY